MSMTTHVNGIMQLIGDWTDEEVDCLNEIQDQLAEYVHGEFPYVGGRSSEPEIGFADNARNSYETTLEYMYIKANKLGELLKGQPDKYIHVGFSEDLWSVDESGSCMLEASGTIYLKKDEDSGEYALVGKLNDEEDYRKQYDVAYENYEKRSDECPDCGEARYDCDCGFDWDAYYEAADDDKPETIMEKPYTPLTMDKIRHILQEDPNSAINQRITLSGIDWRILDVQAGKLLLISEEILETRPYHMEKKEITWESCTLRGYLNNEFFNSLGTAISEIAETRNDNPGNLWYGTSGGNATTDKVFLLSLEEVDRYFGNSGDYVSKRRKDYSGKPSSKDGCIVNAYSKDMIAKDSEGKASVWWLRSPGFFPYSAAFVFTDGYVYVDGIPVSNNGCGVRPALWLNLQS